MFALLNLSCRYWSSSTPQTSVSQFTRLLLLFRWPNKRHRFRLEYGNSLSVNAWWTIEGNVISEGCHCRVDSISRRTTSVPLTYPPAYRSCRWCRRATIMSSRGLETNPPCFYSRRMPWAMQSEPSGLETSRIFMFAWCCRLSFVQWTWSLVSQSRGSREMNRSMRLYARTNPKASAQAVYSWDCGGIYTVFDFELNKMGAVLLIIHHCPNFWGE